MLKSLFGLVTDVTKIITAPVEITTDIVRKCTKPIADISQEVVEDMNDDLGD